jgi:hypothetical protein
MPVALTHLFSKRIEGVGVLSPALTRRYSRLQRDSHHFEARARFSRAHLNYSNFTPCFALLLLMSKSFLCRAIFTLFIRCLVFKRLCCASVVCYVPYDAFL